MHRLGPTRPPIFANLSGLKLAKMGGGGDDGRDLTTPPWLRRIRGLRRQAIFFRSDRAATVKIGPATSGTNSTYASCMNSYADHYLAKFFSGLTIFVHAQPDFSFAKKHNFLF